MIRFEALVFDVIALDVRFDSLDSLLSFSEQLSLDELIEAFTFKSILQSVFWVLIDASDWGELERDDDEDDDDDKLEEECEIGED